MNVTWLYALGSVILVSVLSLLGIAVLWLRDERLERIVPLLVSLAVGALLGGAFVHIIPEVIEQTGDPRQVCLLVLGGFLIFFAIERYLHLRGSGGESPTTLQGAELHHETGGVRSYGYLNLWADGIHNFVDGIAIGAAYLTGPEVGVAATLAIVLHEIPQELGDMGILLHAGFDKRRALLFNLLSACAAIFGTIGALILGASIAGFAEWMLPLAAGGFIYLAAAELVPELQDERRVGKTLKQLAFLIAGIGLMFVVDQIKPDHAHSHGENPAPGETRSVQSDSHPEAGDPRAGFPAQ